MTNIVLDKVNKNKDVQQLAESIKKYIMENDCPALSMDITHLNLMDASKVAIICSTYHWAKYPDGNINWKLNSPKIIKEIIKPLNLGNISFN